MSALQLRAHFILYREWANRLRGRTDLNLAAAPGRRSAQVLMNGFELIAAAQDREDPLPPLDTLHHIVWGLERLGLIGAFEYGPMSERDGDHPDYPFYFEAEPTVPGMELWGWAAGAPGLDAGRFVANAPAINVDPPIWPIASATFPRLPAPPAGEEKLQGV